MEAKTDCFSYKSNGIQETCCGLNDLYCKSGHCSFYRNDISMAEIEADIKCYSPTNYKKRKKSQ